MDPGSGAGVTTTGAALPVASLTLSYLGEPLCGETRVSSDRHGSGLWLDPGSLTRPG